MKRSLLALVWTLILAAAAFGIAAGQASPNFDLRMSALTGGGGTAKSANFQVESAFGDMGGSTTSANILVTQGLIGSIGAANPFAPDSFEQDDACASAKPIAVNAPSFQQHSFHREGDSDWGYFDAQANKTYIIEAQNVGVKANAVIALYNDCSNLGGTGTDSFGTTVRLEWNSTTSQRYYVQFQPYDPTIYGSPSESEYRITVKTDGTPPSAPTSPRCEPKSPSTLGIQWNKSSQRDVVAYRIQYQGPNSGSADVSGKNTTYFELGGLTGNQTYQVRLQAVDFSGNESPFTGQFPCVPTQPQDTTAPTFSLTQPDNSTNFSTSAPQITIVGSASDAGSNLSRARVRVGATEKFDNSLSGNSATFRVESVPLQVGQNSLEVAVLDSAGNASPRTINITRIGTAPGAVVIVAGHNESFGLQANIYNAANRAYRIFKNAGYPDSSIFYMAPVNQDADGNGSNDVDSLGSPANLQAMLQGPVKNLLASQSPTAAKPLFVYMVDHGFAEKYCLAGCTSGSITPLQLDTWLRVVEQVPNVETTVVIEACQSGSFMDRVSNAQSSISKQGRVIITSTGRLNNAYASDSGAYFSDAFFSCLVDSQNLRACFNEGALAVSATGVAQTPWLDDNGDGQSTSADGSVAQGRFVTRNFSSIRPTIRLTSLDRTEGSADGTLHAFISEGAEEVDFVWAAIFPPSFTEPLDVTLNLDVPRVRLEPVPNSNGEFAFTYAGGFPEEGDYRIIFYAQDANGINAQPKALGEGANTYLPMIGR